MIDYEGYKLKNPFKNIQPKIKFKKDSSAMSYKTGCLGFIFPLFIPFLAKPLHLETIPQREKKDENSHIDTVNDSLNKPFNDSINKPPLKPEEDNASDRSDVLLLLTSKQTSIGKREGNENSSLRY